MSLHGYGSFCPDCLDQREERGMTADACIVYSSLDGDVNGDGTLHRHCELCKEEVIGASERQPGGGPRGRFYHVLDDGDCQGSWHYGSDGVPVWGTAPEKTIQPPTAGIELEH